MSLTTTEQLEIISGAVKPPSTDLLTLTHQTAFIFAKSFYDTYKEFPTDDGEDPATGINTLASSYLNKMLGACRDILSNDPKTLQKINRMIVVIIGSTIYTIEQIQSAEQGAWETFVLEQMDEALEYLYDVRRDEKAEYSAIIKSK